MKPLAKMLWTMSLWVTIPIAIIFFYWVSITSDRYVTFKVKYPAAEDFNLKSVGDMEFSNMYRKTIKKLFINNENLESELRSINLAIPNANIEKLNLNLPHSGSEYVKGAMFYDGKFRKVKFKYRGDTVYHWGYYKKSLRVKTSKNKLFEGMRSFNLVAPRSPEIINNHLVSLLAKDMDLMAPRSEVVNVNINGLADGVYVLTEQLDESTLRNSGNMPGDLYSGDVGRKDYFRDMTNQLFVAPSLWEKKAINNHYPEESKKPLERLIYLLNLPDKKLAHAELSSLIDIKAFGRFNAIEILTTTAHVDSTHNWRLYYDPMKSKFVPIVWDFVGWHITTRPKPGKPARLDVISSPLHLFLHENYDFIRARQRALEDFFANNQDKKFLNSVDKLYGPLKHAVESDMKLSANVKNYTGDEVNKELDLLRESIQTTFDDVKNGYVTNGSVVKYAETPDETAYDIRVNGRSIVNKLVFKFKNVMDYSVSARMKIIESGKPKARDITGSISIRGASIEVDISLLANYKPVVASLTSYASFQNKIQVQPGTYNLLFDGLDKNNELLEVLVDRGAGVLDRVEKVPSIEMQSFDDVYSVVHEQPVRAPLIWSGDILIDSLLEVDDELIIEPGTTVRFTSGSSLILSNRLVANGTEDRPIRFVPAVEGQAPWGALVLRGQKASGSKLSHCVFSDGSGLKADLFEYTAMFSVHEVDGVAVDHCRFSDSRLTDDMVHAVYSTIHISDSEFIRSKSDAIDIDISSAVIERTRFIDSGNDAIDLMTSDAVVVDSFISASGDKGVSVGEGSRLLAINNVIAGNAIGVQSKDGSVATLYNVTLDSNKHALDSYKKNWRYSSGGFTFVYKSKLINNLQQLTADKKSRIKVYDSFIDQDIALDKKLAKRIIIDPSVDSYEMSQAKLGTVSRFPIERKKMKGMDFSYLSRSNIKQRGADQRAH
jgi:hypothetical protein